MHACKACLAVALGIGVVSAGSIGCATTKPSNDEEIRQAAARAEQQAARPAAESLAMYGQTGSSAGSPPRTVAFALQESPKGHDATTDNILRVQPVQLTPSEPPENATQSVTQADEKPTKLAAEKPREDTRSQIPASIWEDVMHIPSQRWQDVKNVYTKPTNLALLLTAGGASIALHQHVDWTIANKFDRAHTIPENGRDTFNTLGNPLLHLGVAGGWYLAGYQYKDEKTYAVGKSLLSALVITDLSTLALKGAAAGTETPSDRHGAFPSGHASSSFALASVLHRAYGPLVGVPMYALAGYVGFNRMDDRQHHFSDVVFGAMLGLVVGHSVAGGYLPQVAGGTIIPYADPVDGTAGIAWLKSTK